MQRIFLHIQLAASFNLKWDYSADGACYAVE